MLAGITLVSLSPAALSAQANNPGAQKWETEIAAFEAASDSANIIMLVADTPDKRVLRPVPVDQTASLACRSPGMTSCRRRM